MGRQIKVTVSVECALEMRAESVTRALHQEGPEPIDFPHRHPLMPYLLDGAACGPIPAVLRIGRFEWSGGELSERMLRRFASYTTGRARFVLIVEGGETRGYEIEDGRLFACKVEIAVRRGGAR